MRKLAAVALVLLLFSFGCTTVTSPQQQQQRDVQCGTIISGTVIDAATGKPPASATVTLQSTLRSGVSKIYEDEMMVHTNSAGHFEFRCGFSSSDTTTKYLLNITAADAQGRQYAPVIITDFPLGDLSGKDIGTFMIGGMGRSPVPAATIQGLLTTASSSDTPVSATYYLTAHQTVADTAGSPFTLLVQSDAVFDPPGYQPPTVCYSNGVCVGSAYVPHATQASAACPAGTTCSTYSLQSLASVAPVVRRWGVAEEVQSPDPPLYTVSASVFVGLYSNEPNCSPSTQSTGSQTNGAPLTIAPGAQLTAATLTFTGCR